MTIEKSRDWGESVGAREGGIVVSGDLARELGSSHGTGHEGRWLRLPLDLVAIEAIDEHGRRHLRSVATWVTAGSRLRGDYLIVSSTSFVGGRRIFSRAHPNDGRLDWLAIEPGMSLRQRLAFHRRTRSETHLPHPCVRIGTGSGVSRAFTHPVKLRFEAGEPIIGVVELNAQIRADATHTHIPIA